MSEQKIAIMNIRGETGNFDYEILTIFRTVCTEKGILIFKQCRSLYLFKGSVIMPALYFQLTWCGKGKGMNT